MATPDMLSPSELDQLAEIDPEIKEAVAKSPMFTGPTEITDPVAFVQKSRAAYSLIEASFPPDPAMIHTKSTYTTRDGTSLPLHIYTPSTAPSTPSPILIWYHGGGLCMGSPEMNYQIYLHLIKTHALTIYAPSYRLAPEHKFPTPLNDAWDSYHHITTTLLPGSLTTPLLMGGESAGAMLTALLALRARDEDITPKLTGLYLSAGSYISPSHLPAHYQPYYRSRTDARCMESPFLSWESKKAFDACLQPDYSSAWYRAALWETGFSGLPRCYFQACGMDILRDDTFVLWDVVGREGVETKGDVYPGAPHCFWLAGWDVGVGRKWRGDMEGGWRWLLGVE